MTAAALCRAVLAALLKLESFAAASFLIGAAALPVTELLLRNLFDINIPGATAIRVNMTLWVGFLGAMLASQRGQHLRISAGHDVLPAPSLRRCCR